MIHSNLFPYLNIFLTCLFSSVSSLVPGNVGSNTLCTFPRLDSIDPGIDVLGDREKANICSLPRPSQLCSRGRGEADEACKRIASVAGDTSNPRCLRKRTCGFHVKRPVQHPNEPGDAYVSLCKTEYDGVIFPCRENNLHIVDPFYNEDIFGTVDEPSEPPPNWIEDTSDSTSPVWSSTSLPRMNKTKTPPKNKPKLSESDKEKGSQLFSKYIAYKLSKMDRIQARFAERLISEVTFQGDSGSLNRNVKLVELSEADLANPLPLHPARVGYASKDGQSFKIMDTPDDVRQQRSKTVTFISE
uniref:Uncharacterized protein n=1 Tax=Cacopsylla melanoneura TaxID=428564 RepID=A0A8D9FJ14_9HEMI